MSRRPIALSTFVDADFSQMYVSITGMSPDGLHLITKGNCGQQMASEEQVEAVKDILSKYHCHRKTFFLQEDTFTDASCAAIILANDKPIKIIGNTVFTEKAGSYVMHKKDAEKLIKEIEQFYE